MYSDLCVHSIVESFLGNNKYLYCFLIIHFYCVLTYPDGSCDLERKHVDIVYFPHILTPFLAPSFN